MREESELQCVKTCEKERDREREAEKEMKTAENKLLGSSQMLQVSIETPHTSHSSLFSLHFFIYFVVSSSRIT